MNAACDFHAGPGAGGVRTAAICACSSLRGEEPMNGFIAKTVTVVGLAGISLVGAGCYTYDDLVDPCYPERYEFAARQEVKAAFAPQVGNGHILDQTVWNYHFETGTAVLTQGGRDHLAYLARRRPCPDTCIYLQVAQDIPYDAAAPEKFTAARIELDGKRIQAVEDYLNAQTAGRNLVFTVTRHDPAMVDQSAVEMGISIRLMQTSSQGSLRGAASGVGTSGTAGTAGPPR
jgi:hypothetical protein